MGWVSYFFSGFILVRLPFPLGESFRSMVQQGVSVPGLDASYVSSLSWYFLTLFGFRGLFSIVLGQNNAADDAQLMQQQMQTMQPAAGGLNKDPWSENKQEKIELEITSYEPSLHLAQYRLLGQRGLELLAAAQS
jgi:ER membrane protein complex subunit 3